MFNIEGHHPTSSTHSIIPKQVVICDFNIPSMQLISLDFSNTNYIKLLLNETFQFLVTQTLRIGV